MSRLAFSAMPLLTLAACVSPARRPAAVFESSAGRFNGRFETVASRCGIAGDLTQVERDVVEVLQRRREAQTLEFETAHARLSPAAPATLLIGGRSFELRSGTCAGGVLHGRVDDDGREAKLIPDPSDCLDGTPSIDLTGDILVESPSGSGCPPDRSAQRLWRRADRP